MHQQRCPRAGPTHPLFPPLLTASETAPPSVAPPGPAPAWPAQTRPLPARPAPPQTAPGRTSPARRRGTPGERGTVRPPPPTTGTVSPHPEGRGEGGGRILAASHLGGGAGRGLGPGGGRRRWRGGGGPGLLEVIQGTWGRGRAEGGPPGTPGPGSPPCPQSSPLHPIMTPIPWHRLAPTASLHPTDPNACTAPGALSRHPPCCAPITAPQ